MGAGSVRLDLGNELAGLDGSSADGRESVIAISTSALSSPLSRRICTAEARRVKPALVPEAYAAQLILFTCGVGRHGQLLSI